MLARLWSATLLGIDASLVQVEVDISVGLPVFTMVGLPDSSIRESRDRVRSAIQNSGFEFPSHRVTINLVPASVRKQGTSFDLAIALGVLAAAGHLSCREFTDLVAFGELSLDGSLLPAPGTLPTALAAHRRRFRLLTPPDTAPQAAVVPNLDIVVVRSIRHAVDLLEGRIRNEPPIPHAFEPRIGCADDMSQVRGQRLPRRALEVAAAGGHHVLLIGPPGTGKTMLARRLPGILPLPTFDEAVATTIIHSVAGLISSEDGLVPARPFRAPHHTISDVALVGGGRYPRPGEVSLAHNGVLFLDEIAEFDRATLDVLRQPLEDGIVRIARAAGAAVFPARFLLVAAMNPCPCGYAGDTRRPCRCTPHQIDRYRNRLSGPLRDRFDVIIPVAPVPVDELAGPDVGEPSTVIRQRVVAARRAQRARDPASRTPANAGLSQAGLARHCRLDDDGASLLERAVVRFGLSVRAYDRVRRVARTIADLDGTADVLSRHVAEALSYRVADH